MISIVLVGRNDDYGEGFRQRLFRAANHNASRLAAAGIDFEFVLGEWNPLPGKPLLAQEFVDRVPQARSVVIPLPIHQKYSLNPAMPFHEMAAKNAALRRTRGECVIVTNADILFGDRIIRGIAEGRLDDTQLYRAHRIDVRSQLSWDEMQDPDNQLLSGEGKSNPCWYLGAGGDFCLASRSLWCFLRGFNERIRFSTRAKDWQFYLSAAARGVGINFIGEVFHLDHAEGFRNTGREQASKSTAHFGGPWDIEFGLPLINPDDWGLDGLAESPFGGDPRIAILDPGEYHIPAERESADRKLADWLVSPSEQDVSAIAVLYHAICAAHARHRRLICQIQNPRLLVALSGFQSVAGKYGVQVFCNWTWPETSGFTLPPFKSAPANLGKDDWIASEHDGKIVVADHGSGGTIDVLPRKIHCDNPPFNPLMIRRLLRACLRMQDSGVRRIGIYGAGSHTEDLLRWGLPDSIEVAAIVVSAPKQKLFCGIPVLSVHKARNLGLDTILLSSCSFEPEMAEQAQRSGITRILLLYGDWPAGIWCSSCNIGTIRNDMPDRTQNEEQIR